MEHPFPTETLEEAFQIIYDALGDNKMEVHEIRKVIDIDGKTPLHGSLTISEVITYGMRANVFNGRKGGNDGKKQKNFSYWRKDKPDLEKRTISVPKGETGPRKKKLGPQKPPQPPAPDEPPAAPPTETPVIVGTYRMNVEEKDGKIIGGPLERQKEDGSFERVPLIRDDDPDWLEQEIRRREEETQKLRELHAKLDESRAAYDKAHAEMEEAMQRRNDAFAAVHGAKMAISRARLGIVEPEPTPEPAAIVEPPLDAEPTQRPRHPEQIPEDAKYLGSICRSGENLVDRWIKGCIAKQLYEKKLESLGSPEYRMKPYTDVPYCIREATAKSRRSGGYRQQTDLKYLTSEQIWHAAVPAVVDFEERLKALHGDGYEFSIYYNKYQEHLRAVAV